MRTELEAYLNRMNAYNAFEEAEAIEKRPDLATRINQWADLVTTAHQIMSEEQKAAYYREKWASYRSITQKLARRFPNLYKISSTPKHN